MAIKKGQFTDEKTGDVLYPQTSSDMVEGLENNYLKNNSDIEVKYGRINADPKIISLGNGIWRRNNLEISGPPWEIFDINAPRGRYLWSIDYSTSNSQEDSKQFLIELSNTNEYKISIPINVSMSHQNIFFNIDDECTKLTIYKSRVGKADMSVSTLNISGTTLRYLGEEEPVLWIGDTIEKSDFMVYKNGDIEGTKISEQRLLHFTITKGELSTRISLPPNYDASNCFIIGANYWTRLNPYLIDDSWVACLGNKKIPDQDASIDFLFNGSFIECILTNAIAKHTMGTLLVQKMK